MTKVIRVDTLPDLENGHRCKLGFKGNTEYQNKL